MSDETHPVSADDLINCVRAYAEVSQEIETPCLAMLARAGTAGVYTLGELIHSEFNSDRELFACYAADLLASFNDASVVDVLLAVLERPGTPTPTRSVKASSTTQLETGHCSTRGSSQPQKS